jgi:hypothetical protein
MASSLTTLNTPTKILTSLIIFFQELFIMYLTKLAQRTGEDSMSVTYSDLASVVQV